MELPGDQHPRQHRPLHHHGAHQGWRPEHRSALINRSVQAGSSRGVPAFFLAVPVAHPRVNLHAHRRRRTQSPNGPG